LWSTNWFHDPDAEVARLREAYDKAVASSPAPDPGPSAEPPSSLEPPNIAGVALAVRPSQHAPCRRQLPRVPVEAN
jgi:hypothetical protein